MKIRQIKDNDPELYGLIVPLVMNPKVLKSNNNYPFKNFSGTVWYIAMEDSDVSGFMPLKKNNTGFHIDNYYIRDNDPSVIDSLLDSITEDIPVNSILTALVHKRHMNDFRRNHFIRTRELGNYEMICSALPDHRLNLYITRSLVLFCLLNFQMSYYSSICFQMM